MADKKQPEEKQSFRVEISPRRPSLTSRLIGANREWMQNFIQSQEEDDQQYGHGFNDAADDFIPGVLYNGRRRRNSSVSSDVSSESYSTSETATGRVRTGSISERVAGMQVITEPIEGPHKTTGNSHKIGDINDYSILF